MCQSAPQLDKNIMKQQLLLWRSGDKEAESEVRVAIMAADGGLIQLFVFICISWSFKDPNESTRLLRYSPFKVHYPQWRNLSGTFRNISRGHLLYLRSSKD